MHEFAKVGIEAEFFDAVMGKYMSQEELERLSFPDTYLSPGEIGCALSHIGCYKKFLASEEKCAAIFEDDIILSEEFTKEKLEILGGILEKEKRPTVLALYTGDYDYESLGEVFDDVEIHQAYGLYYTHGYILNRAAAEAVTEIQSPVSFEADAFKMYYFLKGVSLWSLNKDLALQQPEETLPSSITASRYETGNRGVRKKKAFWAKFLAAPLTQKVGILWRRVYKHYLSDVKRKEFLKEISESRH